MSNYFTIESFAEGLYKDKGSKFIGLAYPVISDKEIKNKLEEVKKIYHDARHHCYAWILGLDDQSTRANDDGEPAHSAGDPILGQLKSYGLTNVLMVVVRYFGGTKLGIGGLIHAYRTAADEALSMAGRRQIFEMSRVLFSFDYPQMSIVERLIVDFDVEVLERNFVESCHISGVMKKDNVELFLSSTHEYFNIKISVEK